MLEEPGRKWALGTVHNFKQIRCSEAIVGDKTTKVWSVPAKRELRSPGTSKSDLKIHLLFLIWLWRQAKAWICFFAGYVNSLVDQTPNLTVEKRTLYQWTNAFRRGAIADRPQSGKIQNILRGYWRSSKLDLANCRNTNHALHFL